MLHSSHYVVPVIAEGRYMPDRPSFCSGEHEALWGVWVMCVGWGWGCGRGVRGVGVGGCVDVHVCLLKRPGAMVR